MFNKRSSKKELMDDLTLNTDVLRKNLQELSITNRWLGGKKTLLSALNKVAKKYQIILSQKKIIIADLGCGGGDLLNDISKWAKQHNVDVHIIGIDANPFMIEYAQTIKKYQNIEFKILNIKAEEFKSMRFDIICLNTICHHFEDDDFVELLTQLKEQTTMAIIINDLHRHWFAYYSIKLISQILNFSYLAKHDGPLSVLRAFQKKELLQLLRQANLTTYQIRWTWAFRWQMIIWCRTE